MSFAVSIKIEDLEVEDVRCVPKRASPYNVNNKPYQLEEIKATCSIEELLPYEAPSVPIYNSEDPENKKVHRKGQFRSWRALPEQSHGNLHLEMMMDKEYNLVNNPNSSDKGTRYITSEYILPKESEPYQSEENLIESCAQVAEKAKAICLALESGSPSLTSLNKRDDFIYELQQEAARNAGAKIDPHSKNYDSTSTYQVEEFPSGSFDD